MHHAPSVSYPVGRGAFQHRLLLAQTLLSLLWMLAWALTQPVTWAWIGVSVVLAAMTLLQWRATRPPGRTLLWADGVWVLQPASAPLPKITLRHCVGAVKPVFDGQSTLLLRWQSTSDRLGSGGRWLWLDQSSCPSQWLDLRRAVYGSLR